LIRDKGVEGDSSVWPGFHYGRIGTGDNVIELAQPRDASVGRVKFEVPQAIDEFKDCARAQLFLSKDEAIAVGRIVFGIRGALVHGFPDTREHQRRLLI
jgi:hypothetical protein